MQDYNNAEIMKPSEETKSTEKQKSLKQRPFLLTVAGITLCALALSTEARKKVLRVFLTPIMVAMSVDEMSKTSYGIIYHREGMEECHIRGEEIEAVFLRNQGNTQAISEDISRLLEVGGISVHKAELIGMEPNASVRCDISYHDINGEGERSKAILFVSSDGGVRIFNRNSRIN
jgi:hypothetical protein